jgi:fatty acid desaturase
MPPAGPHDNRADLVGLLLLVALFLFVSPLTAWWAGAGLPWYFPFGLWGLLIALVAAYDGHRSDDDP